MAKAEYHYFQGKASWAKVVQPDLEYKTWTIKVHLTPDSYNKFMKLKEKDGEVEGILNEVKEDIDGSYVIFRRPIEKDWGKGYKEPLTPPEVLDADGNTLKGVFIGNGSDVTVKVDCYRYNKPFKRGKGKAIRLVSIRVDHLVPYSRSDYTPEQEEAVAGLELQPKQNF